MGLLLITFLLLAGAVAVGAYLSILFTGKPLDMGFLGALIGAAGTIFAATVAYVAVQKQIAQATQAAVDQARKSSDLRRQQLTTEISGAHAVVEYCKRMEQSLQNALDEENRGNTAALLNITKAGLVTSFSGFAPLSLVGAANDVSQRLNILSNEVRNSNPVDIKQREKTDIAIADLRQDMKNLIQQARKEIDSRSQERATLE